MNAPSPQPARRGWRANLKLAAKGFGMGIADVIPGISGGTIAFITGIYEELISAVRSFDAMFFRDLLCLRLNAALGRAHWRFLAVLLSGILAAVFTLAHAVEWMLTNRPDLLFGFFFGLISATVLIIFRQLREKNRLNILIMLLAASVMYHIVGMVPVRTPDHPVAVFLSGAVAICAMILPGISGSFILLLLGKYQTVIAAVSGRDFGLLTVFAGGCAVGLLSFVRLVHWCLKHQHDRTIALLTGLVIGSLRKIWPWKLTLEAILKPDGEMTVLREMNVLPPGLDLNVLMVLALAVAGYLLAMGLEDKGA